MNTFAATLLRLLPALLCTGLAAAPATAQCVFSGPTAAWQSFGSGCGTPSLLTVIAPPVMGTTALLSTINQPANTILTLTSITLTTPGAPTTNLAGFIPLAGGCLNLIPNPDAYVMSVTFGAPADVALGIPNSVT